MKVRKKPGATAAAKPAAAGPFLTQGRRRLLAMLALCVITLLAYSNSFTAGFAFDNRGLLLNDPRIREATEQNILQILRRTYWWPYGESGLYRPFTTLTYLFNYAILGNANQPAGYHWISFLLHAGNVLLAFVLALRLIKDWWPSFFAAAVWAVHPALTESVTNMVGRSDLLAGMALLSGLLAYLKSSETEGARRWAWLAGLAGVTAMGVFSKESAAAILGVLVLYEATWPDRRRLGALALGGIAVLLPLGAMLYARAAVFSKLPPTSFPFWDNPLTGADFWTARLTAVKIVAQYLGLLVWPARLSCDYSYSQIPLATGSPGDWLAWIVVAAAAAAAVLAYRFNRTVFFLAGMGFLTFLPTSNLLFPIGTIMAERFLYMPSIAAAACIVLALYAIGPRIGVPRLAPAALCLIVAAFAVRTWLRNTDWQDDLSLMSAAVEASRESYKSHALLGAALYAADPAHANIDRAIGESEKSVAILDPLPDAHRPPTPYRQTGGYYIIKGDMQPQGGGAAAYQRAAELLLRCRAIVQANFEDVAAQARAQRRMAPEPDNAKIGELERTISAAFMRLRDPQKAHEAAARALELDPMNTDTYRQLSASLLALGRADESAIVLVQGVLVTTDMSLRRELLSHYLHGLDPRGCATIPGPNGPAMNPECEIVRRHTCAGTAETLRLYQRIGRRDLADQLRSLALSGFRCPEDLGRIRVIP